MNVELVLDAGAQLGECPVWDSRADRLFWIDIDGKAINAFDPASGANEVRDLPGRPGSFAMTSDPDVFLLAMETSLVWFRWDTGELAHWIDLEEAGTGNRLNDGRTDPAGRFWVGSMFERPTDGRFTGFLHRVEAQGQFTTVRGEVGVTNGSAFGEDGTTMYWADTLRDTVWAYDFDPAGGEQTNERVFVDFTALSGRPDGACVDSVGGYWIACVYGWAVRRISPDGKVDLEIELPIEKPTMPAFGGPDLATLFVTSIGSGGSSPSSAGQHGAGGIFAIETGHQGLAEPFFAGSPA